MRQPPFELEFSECELMRTTDKSGQTILVLERQLYNVTIKRYTEPLFWDTQW